MSKNEIPNEIPGKEIKSIRMTGWVVGLVQLAVLAGIAGGLVLGGFLLFRGTMLERYIEKKIGYPCEVAGFDFDPRQSLIELHDVTIWNIDPFPRTPLATIRRIRLEWDPMRSQQFPKQLRLLEVELDTLTLIRLDGNRFNILYFVEALVEAWGSNADLETQNKTREPLHIEECWLLWDTLVALDEEVEGGKRMEVLVEYEAHHENVSRIRDITDPAIKTAKDEVDTFYFFNYLGDSLRSLLK